MDAEIGPLPAPKFRPGARSRTSRGEARPRPRVRPADLHRQPAAFGIDPVVRDLILRPRSRRPSAAKSHNLMEQVPAINPAATRLGLQPTGRRADADPGDGGDAPSAPLPRSAARPRRHTRPFPGAPVRMLEKTPKNALRVPFLASASSQRRGSSTCAAIPGPTLASMIEGWRSGTVPHLSRACPAGGASDWSFLLIPGWRRTHRRAAGGHRRAAMGHDHADPAPTTAWGPFRETAGLAVHHEEPPRRSPRPRSLGLCSRRSTSPGIATLPASAAALAAHLFAARRGRNGAGMRAEIRKRVAPIWSTENERSMARLDVAAIPRTSATLMS